MPSTGEVWRDSRGRRLRPPSIVKLIGRIHLRTPMSWVGRVRFAFRVDPQQSWDVVQLCGHRWALVRFPDNFRFGTIATPVGREYGVNQEPVCTHNASGNRGRPRMK